MVLAWYFPHLSSKAASPARRALSPARAVAVARGLPAAEAGLMPWHLAAPISRAVAVADPSGRLIALGGLTAGGGSASGVYAIRTATGAVRPVGALSAPLHDAAVAVIGRHAVVFGGGSPATVATVQSFTLGAPHGRARPATATPPDRCPRRAPTRWRPRAAERIDTDPPDNRMTSAGGSSSSASTSSEVSPADMPGDSRPVRTAPPARRG